MLRSLHISNYILIDSLDVTFPEGLVIITGQTGAGKSILLGALSLLSGAKADPSQISEGAETCVVEAEFEGLADDGNIAEILSENDIDVSENGLTVRRVLSRTGRSRCFVNDIPVGIQCLAALSERLVDIHSQHKSLLLTDKSFQLAVLDRFASNGPLLGNCASLWKELCEVRRELEKLKSQLESDSADNDYKQAMYRQLEDAMLRSGELEELEQEHKLLASAGQILEGVGGALDTLRSRNGDTPSVSGSIRDALRSIEKLSGFMPSLESLSERLESARIEIDDIADEMESICGSTDIDGARLEAVESRQSLLYSLMRRHSCTSVEELISLRDSLSDSFFDAERIQEQIATLENCLGTLEKSYKDICETLHTRRQDASEAFSAEIMKSLAFLELDRAVFEVEISESSPSLSGTDSICFKFSASGSTPSDVAKCASGGELSRIMLCLKEMMARYFGMPTMIFDEIDTGVSGSVADKMGSMICRMGSSMQLFSITHLPQVAAKGNAHYVVSKHVSDDGRTLSSIRKLSGEERIMEVARMLSGSEITPAAVENAKSLLLNAGR